MATDLHVDLELRYQRERRQRLKAEERADRMAAELKRFRIALQAIRSLEKDWKRLPGVTGEAVANRALEIAKAARPS